MEPPLLNTPPHVFPCSSLAKWLPLFSWLTFSPGLPLHILQTLTIHNFIVPTTLAFSDFRKHSSGVAIFYSVLQIDIVSVRDIGRPPTKRADKIYKKMCHKVEVTDIKNCDSKASKIFQVGSDTPSIKK